VVEIFAFLELEQISADFENYHFSKVSLFCFYDKKAKKESRKHENKIYFRVFVINKLSFVMV